MTKMISPRFLECKKCECRFHISSFESQEESICEYCEPKEKTKGFRG